MKDREASEAQDRRALPWGAALVVPCAGVAGLLMADGTWPWLLAAGAALAGVMAGLSVPRGGAQAAGPDAAVRTERGGRADAARPSAEAAQDAAHDMLLRRAIEVRCAERTAVLDALGDGVLLVDPHGETLYANHAAEHLLGKELCVPGTRAALESLPPVALRAVQGVIAARSGERRRAECELRDTQATPAVVSAASLGDEGRAVVVIRDVRAEREADAMKSEFVQKASHELRTPLATVRAYAEMLQDGEAKDDAERAQFVATILAECQRLGALVDDMLDIGRIESGVARARLAEVDFAALAGECVAEMQGLAQERSIELVVARASAGAVAWADRGMFKRVVVNLLSNALKYTPKGGTVRVEVDVDSLARSVVFSVRDTGLGIPAHALPRLFGKFYRVEQHERVAKGTGLGLNLCRNIVETVHGGQIGVESEQGRGSRFWFAVPVEQAGRKAA